MADGIIYLVTCRVTGKHYVGQTVGPLWRRWKQHKGHHSGPHNRVLYAAIKKYGADAFSVVELDQVDLLANLNARELYWSQVYNSIAPNGYNLRAGNGHAIEVSDMTRARLRVGTKRAWADPSMREKRIRAITESQRRPDVRTRKSVGTTESWSKPKTRTLRTARSRAAVNSPEERARRSAQQTPAARAKTAGLMRARWKDPMYRAAMLPHLEDHVSRTTRDPVTGRWTS